MAAMEHDTPTSTAAPASIIQPVRSGAVHGWFLRPDDRLHVGRRDCSALADKMGWQVTAVEKALLQAGLDPLPPITPVLCFVDGDWPLIAPPDVFRGGQRHALTTSHCLLVTY